jgi:hypothetical protein
MGEHGSGSMEQSAVCDTCVSESGSDRGLVGFTCSRVGVSAHSSR